MLTVGNILFFTPFYFKNSSDSKPKYFIVLKITETETIIATLPSSKIYLPSSVTASHGCVDIPDDCINCYLFEENRPITTNGFAFKLPTVVYGPHLDEYKIETLTDKYPTLGIDYKIIGKLIDKEYESIIACFMKSPFVKKKYKKMLSQ